MSEVLSVDTLKIKLSELSNILAQKIDEDFKDNPLRHQLGALSGISGIGLAIISYLSEDLSDWDECLMIS